MRFRLLIVAVGVVLVATACQPNPGSIGAPVTNVSRAITFPVQGAVRFSDDWGDCRGAGCSRKHEGIDMLGTKHTPVVAAASGTVTYMRLTGNGAAGNSLAITDAEGWTYWYIHLNNDTPGTDDGMGGVQHAVAPGISKGATVRAGQVIGYLGDSGNAEETAPHLHFEIDMPGNVNIDPYNSLQSASPLAAPASGGALAGSTERTLKRGLTGADVLAWQQKLVAVVGPRFVPNGVFGPATEATTKEFQTSAGLTADGIVGRASRAAMAARHTG